MSPQNDPRTETIKLLKKQVAMLEEHNRDLEKDFLIFVARMYRLVNALIKVPIVGQLLRYKAEIIFDEELPKNRQELVEDILQNTHDSNWISSGPFAQQLISVPGMMEK